MATAAAIPEQEETEQSEQSEQAEKQNPDYFGPADIQQLDDDTIALLRTLARKASTRELAARLQEIKRAAEQRFFYLGEQYIWWNQNVGAFQVGQQGGGFASGQDSASRPSSQRAYNIYLGYGKSFMSVFSQNSPGTRFEADDPNDSTDIKAAEESNKYRKIFEKYCNPKHLQTEIARYLWTDGRVVTDTRHVTNGELYGYTVGEDGQKVPNGREVATPYGVLETKVPLTARAFNEWSYCKISKEYEVSTKKDEFPDKAKSIQQGGKSYAEVEEVARNARISTAEGIRWLAEDAIAHLCTEDRYWFRPSFFRELDEEDAEKLRELFPSGCQVTFVGTIYCESRDESMDDHLTVMHSLPGDGQARISLGRPMVAVQMEFNDFVNMLSDYGRYGIPIIWSDQDAVDIDAITEQASEPGNHMPMTKEPGMPAENHFFAEPVIDFPEALLQHIENLQGPLAQFLTGQMPALFGGNMEDQKTARGYGMARDQALGLMALVWIPYKQVYSRIVEQAARDAVKNRQGEGTLAAMIPDTSGKGLPQNVVVAVANMQGNVTCTPETDENFPESWTQKSNKFFNLLSTMGADPMFVQALELNNPDNADMFKRLTGLEDLTSLVADSRNKQLAEIALMVAPNAAPVPDVNTIDQEMQQSQMAGVPPPIDPQSMPMTSSVPIDVECDNHQVEAQECLRWLNAPEGQKAKVQNPPGYQNVRLHYLEHKKIVEQQAMAAAMAAIPPSPQGSAPAKPGTPSPPKPQPQQPV